MRSDFDRIRPAIGQISLGLDEPSLVIREPELTVVRLSGEDYPLLQPAEAAFGLPWYRDDCKAGTVRFSAQRLWLGNAPVRRPLRVRGALVPSRPSCQGCGEPSPLRLCDGEIGTMAVVQLLPVVSDGMKSGSVPVSCVMDRSRPSMTLPQGRVTVRNSYSVCE